jgi:hypothetical protein
MKLEATKQAVGPANDKGRFTQNYVCVYISEKEVYGFAFYKYGSATINNGFLRRNDVLWFETY